jgi:4'-phosphopantetheinyl transferase
VHVWRARVPASLPALPLGADDHARAARFRNEADARRFLFARGVLNILLGAYAGVDAAAVRIERTCPWCGDPGHGKPRLPAPRPPVRFNMSHSGDIVLLAFCADREVGVDVERIDAGVDARELARHAFAPDRHGEVRAAGDSLPAFYREWTRQEALLKMRGTGLVDPPGPPVPSGPAVVQDVDAGPGYAAALAVEGAIEPAVRRLEWSG